MRAGEDDSMRITRLEEQMSGIRAEMAEFKADYNAGNREVLETLRGMQGNFVSRDEIIREVELREKAMHDKVGRIEERQTSTEETLQELKDSWSARPNWGVTLALTSAFSLITGLIVALVGKH